MNSYVSILFAFAIFIVLVKAENQVETRDAKNPLTEEFNLREKRSIGVDENYKKEIELKTKHGGSLKISRTISYNDGGAIAHLPTLLDSIGNNRIRLLNQLQNGRGRPYLNQPQTQNSSPTNPSDFDFSSDLADNSRHVDIGNGQINISSGLGQVSIGAGNVPTSNPHVAVGSIPGNVNIGGTTGQVAINSNPGHVTTSHVVVAPNPSHVVFPVVSSHVATGHVNCNIPSHGHSVHHRSNLKERIHQKLALNHALKAERHDSIRSKIQGLQELKAYKHELLHKKIHALVAAKRAPPPCGCVTCCNH